MAEKGWRSPGEVWRAYEARHMLDGPLPDPYEVKVERRLTPDEQVAAQVLDARIDRAEALARIDAGYTKVCRIEHQARTERFIATGGRDLV
jgi:hypothetical protein